LIRLHDVSYAFPGAGRREFLKHIDLVIRDGEWVAVAGANGSGKTTLCRLLALMCRPSGGDVDVDGTDPVRGRAEDRGVPAVGIAFQNPDSQFVTSSVEREIAFGMENLGIGSDEMKSRLGAAARLFAIEPLLERNPHTLSGGEKQRLLLACLWAMRPRHLVLDEPFSFLDGRGRASFLDALHASFRSEGKTIVWCTVDAREVRLADRVVYMDGGEIRFDGSPAGLEREIPPGELESSLISHDAERSARESRTPRPPRDGASRVIDVNGARFSPGGDDFVLDVPSFSVASAERIGICGPSGSGKTTLLLACAGLLPPQKGTVAVLGAPVRSRRDFPAGRVAFLFQSPEEGFFAPTVREEVGLACRSFARCGAEEAVARALDEAGLEQESFLARNPFHLSQGEKRLVALASVLALDASLVLLDEPTIFLDGAARRRFRSALDRLSSRGATVVMASHDDAFLRECMDRIVTLEGGRLT
jgi:energy-coupling factor transporter ATP-binding protein EcfA2